MPLVKTSRKIGSVGYASVMVGRPRSGSSAAPSTSASNQANVAKENALLAAEIKTIQVSGGASSSSPPASPKQVIVSVMKKESGGYTSQNLTQKTAQETRLMAQRVQAANVEAVKRRNETPLEQIKRETEPYYDVIKGRYAGGSISRERVEQIVGQGLGTEEKRKLALATGNPALLPESRGSTYEEFLLRNPSVPESFKRELSRRPKGIAEVKQAPPPTVEPEQPVKYTSGAVLGAGKKYAKGGLWHTEEEARASMERKEVQDRAAARPGVVWAPYRGVDWLRTEAVLGAEKVSRAAERWAGSVPFVAGYLEAGVGFVSGLVGTGRIVLHPVDTLKSSYELGKSAVTKPRGTLEMVGARVGAQIETKGLPFVGGEFAGYYVGGKAVSKGAGYVASKSPVKVSKYKVEVTKKGGEVKTVATGYSLDVGKKSRLQVGTSEGKLEVNPTIKLSNAELKKGISIETAGEQEIITRSVKSKYAPSELRAEELAVKISRTLETTRSRYIVKKWSAEVKSLTPEQVKEVLKFAKKEGEVYGSFGAKQQLKPKGALPEEKGVYYHFTTKKGAEKILKTGIIESEKGHGVYLTDAKTANQFLKMGYNPMGSKGKVPIAVRLTESQVKNLFRSKDYTLGGNVEYVYKGKIPASQVGKATMGGYRTPGDIDVIFKDYTPEQAAEAARKLSARLNKVKGGYVTSVEGDSLIVSKVAKGKTVHAVDIHSGEASSLELSNTALTKKGFAGLKFGQKPEKIEGVKVMSLSEQGLRKGGSIFTAREKGFAPEAHRIKDVGDWFDVYETLESSKIIKSTGLKADIAELKGLMEAKYGPLQSSGGIKFLVQPKGGIVAGTSGFGTPVLGPSALVTTAPTETISVTPLAPRLLSSPARESPGFYKIPKVSQYKESLSHASQRLTFPSPSPSPSPSPKPYKSPISISPNVSPSAPPSVSPGRSPSPSPGRSPPSYGPSGGNSPSPPSSPSPLPSPSPSPSSGPSRSPYRYPSPSRRLPPSTPSVVPYSRGSSKGALGFNVYVRRRGKFRKENIKPLVYEEALSFGSQQVRTSAAATFKVVPIGQRITGKYRGPPANIKEFIAKPGGVFVQPSRKRPGFAGGRITTRGEKSEISYVGVATRRAGKNKKKLFGGGKKWAF